MIWCKGLNERCKGLNEWCKGLNETSQWDHQYLLQSFAKNKNVLVIHKVQTSADKEFIWMLLDLVNLSDNREKVSGLSENRKKFWLMK